MLFNHSGVNLAALRTVKLSPALLIWLSRKTCTIRRSGGLVSASQRTHTPRRLPAWATRGPASHTEFSKERPYDPGIFSLRHDCLSFASVSRTWSPLDGGSTGFSFSPRLPERRSGMADAEDSKSSGRFRPEDFESSASAIPLRRSGNRGENEKPVDPPSRGDQVLETLAKLRQSCRRLNMPGSYGRSLENSV